MPRGLLASVFSSVRLGSTQAVPQRVVGRTSTSSLDHGWGFRKRNLLRVLFPAGWSGQFPWAPTLDVFVLWSRQRLFLPHRRFGHRHMGGLHPWDNGPVLATAGVCLRSQVQVHTLSLAFKAPGPGLLTSAALPPRGPRPSESPLASWPCRRSGCPQPWSISTDPALGEGREGSTRTQILPQLLNPSVTGLRSPLC